MSLKGQATASDFEVDAHDSHYQSALKSIRLADTIRVSLTALALLMGITIVGVSGDTLAVYNTTHVSGDFLLPLWPDEFDLRPTIALVAGGVIVLLTNIVSVVSSKAKVIRHRAPVHTPFMFAAPFVGLAAAIIGISFFYAINASTTIDTLQSWSCQWRSVSMTQKPHFGTLCRESQTALYLSIILIPVEALIFGIASWQMMLEKKAEVSSRQRKSSSPALS